MFLPSVNIQAIFISDCRHLTPHYPFPVCFENTIYGYNNNAQNKLFKNIAW